MSATVLKLHESEYVSDPAAAMPVLRLRVPSGWIYVLGNRTPVFVPEPGLYQQER